MPLYRIKKDGHFMGKYYTAGTELELYDRQAKYALMSGQLEDVVTHAMTQEKAKAYVTKMAMAKKAKDGERSNPRRGTVGASTGMKRD